MRKSIALAPLVLFATVFLSIALTDRLKERASQDRFSFGDSSATEALGK